MSDNNHVYYRYQYNESNWFGEFGDAVGDVIGGAFWGSVERARSKLNLNRSNQQEAC